ncbi:Class II abasic (AP) endonuclease [Linnemannia zychae]|nr:Class II abasic (AP) endonuclease [Linnemannia zychae]
MKFMTWNVNGIRTLIQYHPYCDDLNKNYKAQSLTFYNYLGADIICLQETKISRAKLDTTIALVPGYDSYWSFHRTKSGYSGVVIFIKNHIKLLGAEEGISGIQSGYIPAPIIVTNRNQGVDNVNNHQDEDHQLADYIEQNLSFEQTVARIVTQFPEIDNEGRGLILDFGFFALFNLYCPNETDEQRRPFKMAYYHLLEARVRDFMARGKEVIVMGDMNVIPTELDHCDPERWKKECGETDFGNTAPRRWFNALLAPRGPLTDLFRVFHKDEKGAFTCWNTKINARPSNYGTRLDYILVTEKLIPWFTSCDRQPQIVGSDHCPVVAEMAAELVLHKNELENQGLYQQQQQQKDQGNEKFILQDILDSYGGTTDHPLAARFFDEFSGKQQKLSAFFKKPASSSDSIASNKSLVSKVATTTMSASTILDKRPANSQESISGNAPRKKPFFSMISTSSTSSSSSSIGTDSQIGIPTQKLSSQLTGPDIIPKTTINKSLPKSGSTTAAKKSSVSKTPGQQSVLSFFGVPTKKPNKDTTSESSNGVISSLQQDASEVTSASQKSMSSTTSSTTVESTESSQDTISLSLLSSTTAATTTAPTTTSFSPRDYADWILPSQDVLPFSVNEEETTTKWQTLFTPKAIPKCKVHNIPCTEFTVNKKGPNKGRRFYLCSL